jgi:ligand-binding sensor domain-containing protein
VKLQLEKIRILSVLTLIYLVALKEFAHLQPPVSLKSALKRTPLRIMVVLLIARAVWEVTAALNRSVRSQ